MPGSVAAAAPATVLPYSLAVAFSQTREFVVDENRYRAGEVQVVALTAISRKRWALTKALVSAELGALRTFFLARKGGTEEFYFYDVYETTPKFSYDVTGAATGGRYAVRFEGGFQQTLGLARHAAQIALVEVA